MGSRAYSQIYVRADKYFLILDDETVLHEIDNRLMSFQHIQSKE